MKQHMNPTVKRMLTKEGVEIMLHTTLDSIKGYDYKGFTVLPNRFYKNGRFIKIRGFGDSPERANTTVFDKDLIDLMTVVRYRNGKYGIVYGLNETSIRTVVSETSILYLHHDEFGLMTNREMYEYDIMVIVNLIEKVELDGVYMSDTGDFYKVTGIQGDLVYLSTLDENGKLNGNSRVIIFNSDLLKRNPTVKLIHQVKTLDKTLMNDLEENSPGFFRNRLGMVVMVRPHWGVEVLFSNGYPVEEIIKIESKIIGSPNDFLGISDAGEWEEGELSPYDLVEIVNNRKYW